MLINFNNGLRKGYNSVYHYKVHCPVCKEHIYANALTCPYCKTDFTKAPYNKRNNWQNRALKITLLISIFIGIIVCLLGVPVLLGILIGLILYGAGYNLIQRIQSFKNFHHK